MKRNSFYLVVTLLFFLGCDPKPVKQALGGTFLFIKGDVLLNDAAAKLGAEVKESDTIEVKEKSRAVLQLDSALVIHMQANSKLQVSKLGVIQEKSSIETMQQGGTVFHKLKPGSSQYRVRTPTVTAAVRGTAFEISVRKKKEVQVKLLTGKVEVSNSDQSKTVTLEKNQKVTAKKKKFGKVKKLGKKDQKRLGNLNKLEASSSSEGVSNILKTKKASLEKEKARGTKKAAVKKKEKKLTLDDLRKKYGTLTKVITKDGKTYTGAYQQVGSTVVIITTSGKKKVPSVNVKKVTPL